jgi:cytoskeletal protein RodZ
MVDLRHEREGRGFSLDDVADQARIPRRYIEAMEAGDTATLPPGPFLRGYRRQYLEFLGLPPDAITTLDEISPPEPEEQRELPEYVPSGTTATFPLRDEIPIGKLVAVGFLLSALVVLGLKVGTVALDRGGDPSLVTVAATTQRVTVRAVEPTRVDAFADDSWHHRGTLPAGDTIEVESALPIEVAVGDLTRVVVSYNGERLEPLHDLTANRRLVFIATAGDR